MITHQSRLVGRPLREEPSGLDPLSAAAVRGGYLRSPGSEAVWLPLGGRVLQRLKSGLLNTVSDDGSLHSAGRRGVRELSVLIDREIQSYRDLPVSLRAESLTGNLEIAWVTAAETRDRLLEVHASRIEELQVYWRLLGLSPSEVELGSGSAWMQPSPHGSTKWLRCEQCGYRAEPETAAFRRGVAEAAEPQGVEEIATPGARTIAALCAQLAIEPRRTMKSLLFTTGSGDLVLAILRGDLELSTAKLSRCLGGTELRPALEGEILDHGLVPGYAGPVGIDCRTPARPSGVWVLADRSVEGSGPWVVGANREGYHLRGVSYPRDYSVTEVADLALAVSGAGCERCDGVLDAERGFTLCEWDVPAAGIRYVGRDGREGRGALGALTTSLRDLFFAVLSVSQKERGIAWPAACAPFDVHALDLGAEGLLAAALASLERDVEVLLDDRDVSAGVKFGDADWIGCPFRLVAGRKAAAQGGIELSTPGGVSEILPPEAAANRVLDSARRSYVSNS